MIETLLSSVGYCVIDTAQKFVGITPYAGSPYWRMFTDSAGHGTFQAGDNIKILSFGITVPSYCQVISYDPATLAEAGGVGLNIGIDDGSGTVAKIYKSSVPFAPYEYSAGVYKEVPKIPFQLVSFLQGAPADGVHSTPGIATGLVPSLYNGTRIDVYSFIKIEHTLAVI